MKTTFPESLIELSDEALEALRVDGLAEFDTLYTEEFASISDEDAKTLSSLTDGLDAVFAEQKRRSEKASTLAGLADKRGEFAKVSGTFTGETEEEEATEVALTTGTPDGAAALAVEPGSAAADRPVAFATGEGLGVGVDAPLSWDGIGKALDRRLGAFNVTPYRNAASSGRQLKQVQSFAAFKRDIPEDCMVRDGGSRDAVRKAVEFASDEKRLTGGSLVASGGWGAPSQIDYPPADKLSSRDGIATFPEIGVERGGLQITRGLSFAEVFASEAFISFDEAQDIDGEYAIESGVQVEGAKPVYRITPKTWIDYRLRVDGVHIQAGILESRGYPEGIANEVAQVMDVHAHKINAKVIAAMVAGSTAVTMPATQAGAAAPLLTAIDLQATHYRDTHRMALDSSLEVKLPHWTRGVIRADLARRLGVDLLDVSEARIAGWFRDRQISVEYVYDWQSLASTAVASFTSWPTTVTFSLYAAGTWVKGGSEVISLDTMYDSTLLGTNDYTVLFTEEGWFLAKARHDSRVVTTSITPTGVTHIGDEILANGTAA